MYAINRLKMIEIELVKPWEMSVKKPQAGFERQ
jgi:hypothetical protein